MIHTSSEDLTARFDRLERQNRQLRRLCLGCLIGASLLTTLGARQVAKNGPKTVEAERFLLRDKQGRMRAILDMAPDRGPILAFYDEKGKNRIVLDMDQQGNPALNLFDERGNSRTALGVELPKRGVGLSVYDENNNPRVILGTTHEDWSSLCLYGRGAAPGEARIKLSVSPVGGEANATFYDEESKARVALGLMGEQGTDPALAINDKNQKQRISLGIQPNGAGRVALMDAGEKPLVRLATDPEGNHRLRRFLRRSPRALPRARRQANGRHAGPLLRGLATRDPVWRAAE